MCYLQDGFKSRKFQPQVVNRGDIGHYEYFQYLNEKFYPCTPSNIRSEADSWNGYIRCYQSKENQPIQLAIIGDSHAEHLFPGFAEALVGINIAEYGRSGMPLLSNREFEKTFKYVIGDKNIRVVILAARWNAKVESRDKIKAELLDTVNYLGAANKLVYIADDIPSFTFEPGQCKYSGRIGVENNCEQESKYFKSQIQEVSSILKKVEEESLNVKVVNIGIYFCDEILCSMARDGILFYRDSHHLNIEGSKYLGHFIAQKYPEMAK